MPYQLPNGRTLPLDVAWEYDGVSYPANWLRLSKQLDRDRLGIVWVPDAPSYDQRFYWGFDTDGNLIPKDHAELVTLWSGNTRQVAGSLLTSTDWQVIREADNGTVMDADWKAWRESVRAAAGTKIAAIEATTDTDGLAAYVVSSDYTSWPRDPDTPEPVVADDPAADGVESDGDGFDAGGFDGTSMDAGIG